MKAKNIKEKIKFYEWFKSIGGDLKSLEVEKIDLNKPIFIRSSFKKRANLIKEQYNYKFPKLVEFSPIFMNVTDAELFIKKDFVVTN